MARSIKNASVEGAPIRGALSTRALSIAALLLPFSIFFLFFFLWPLFTLIRDSFLDNNGQFTFSLFSQLLKPPFSDAYLTSIRLAGISAIVSAVPGALLAYLIEAKGTNGIRRIVSSITGVLANSGGVPLAFMFVGTLGIEGTVTHLLTLFGLDLYGSGFNLFSFTGLVIVYCYFQIPLMIIVFSPAVSSIRREWREAATTLGASGWFFWRSVGIPLLFPAFASALLLLFASAFSAYATARAMFSGQLNLVPLLIGNLIDGNVIMDQMNQGKALAMGMVLVSAITIVPYLILQRRLDRWKK